MEMKRLEMNKKGQQIGNLLVSIALTIVILTFIIVIGMVLLSELKTQADGDANVNATVDALSAELGTGGLAGWVGLVVLALVGFAIIGFFVGRRGRSA